MSGLYIALLTDLILWISSQASQWAFFFFWLFPLSMDWYEKTKTKCGGEWYRVTLLLLEKYYCGVSTALWRQMTVWETFYLKISLKGKRRGRRKCTSSQKRGWEDICGMAWKRLLCKPNLNKLLRLSLQSHMGISWSKVRTWSIEY